MSIANIRAKLSRGESLENLKLPVLTKSKLVNELEDNDFKNGVVTDDLVDEPTLILHGVKVSDLKREVKNEVDDSKFLDNKLNGYNQVDYKTLKEGDHFRITSNIYKQDGRKCSYMIVKKVLDDGKLKCNSYKELYSDWVIDPENRWKNYRFYVKPPVTPCGRCMRCEKRVSDPYLICLDCRLRAD